ncbi:hypothetical protein AB0J74_17885 [Asanoa sp. NPDC049573]|uniref:hypothetical protein n=1 Tax=Asanoa sp. NPDC049573 TaxID=3155396 RepID=UPI00341EC185
MRVLDRLTAVAAALAFVLVGLGAPACGAISESGAVVAAAHRLIDHEAPSVLPATGRPVDAPATTSDRPHPPSGNPRAVAAHFVHPAASSDPRTDFSAGKRVGHPADVVSTDGPDDLLLAAPVGMDGTLDHAVAATRYRQPVVPQPPGGAPPTRAPPTYA